jgi:hypothetical protein
LLLHGRGGTAVGHDRALPLNIEVNLVRHDCGC